MSITVAQESAKGTFVLFLGNALSTGIATITTVFVARLLGPDGYGIYTLAFVIPLALIQFVGLGVNIAITRYVAFHISKGELDRARGIAQTATVFLLVCGVLLASASYLSSSYLVSAFLHRPELLGYVQLASVWALGVALMQATQAAFVGWAAMTEASELNIILALLKLALTVGLVLLGLGVYGAVLGHVLSYILVGGISVAALYFQKMRSQNGSVIRSLEDLKSMLRYGFPLFAGQMGTGLSSQYATVVLAAIASNAVVGYYQAASNVTVAMTVLSGAISLTLLRSFAALHGLKEDISLAFAYSVKYSSYVLTPLAFFLLAAAVPLVDILYGPSYAASATLLEIAAVALLPVSIGLPILASFFSGVGASRLTLAVSLMAAISLAAGSYFLGAVLGLSAQGIMFAFLISNFASTAFGLFLSRKYLGTRLPLGPLNRIFAAGLLAWLIVWLLPLGSLASIESLLIDTFVYLLAYLTLVPLLLGMDGEDLLRLSIALETMGSLRSFFGAFLSYEKYVLRLRERTTIRSNKKVPQNQTP